MLIPRLPVLAATVLHVVYTLTISALWLLLLCAIYLTVLSTPLAHEIWAYLAQKIQTLYSPPK